MHFRTKLVSKNLKSLELKSYFLNEIFSFVLGKAEGYSR